MDTKTSILVEVFGSQKRWVNYEQGTKRPLQPNGQPASIKDLATLSTYEEVAKVSSNVGIVFTEDKLLLGIDMDDCIVEGVIQHEQKEKIKLFVEKANTYTEVSPSGTGLHSFLSVESPIELEANRKGSFEIYNSRRYFTVTNNIFGEVKQIRKVSTEEAIKLLEILGYPWGKKETQKEEVVKKSGIITLDDATIIYKMFESKNGDKIKSLYEGDLSAYNNDDSAADLALCSHLAFWCAKDPVQMERIWLASPLGNREKTQSRKDYRNRTIVVAIDSCGKTYSGEGSSDIAENIVTIEEVEVMLYQIPSETPPLKRKEALAPIFKSLLSIDKMTAEVFILNNIKEYFEMTKEDAKKYLPYLNWMRVESKREEMDKKRNSEKVPLIIDRDIDYQEAYAAISEIGIINKDLLDIIIAVVVSAKLRLNPPLWLFLIGVPSSFKTELVGLFSAMEEVYTLDTLTENAFASGYMPPDGSDPHDLLPLLDNMCFIIKDLNTLFSMNEEMVKKILGDLTGIFDGSYEKFTATRGMIGYKSSFSMIGCVTPSMLIEHYNYATKLGPRFLFLRVPELTKEELDCGLEKSWKDTGRKENIIKARQIVSSYCSQLIKKLDGFKLITETGEIQRKINSLSKFIAQARGIALTSKNTFTPKGETKPIDYYEIKDFQTEQPWRILGQLKALLKIVSVIHLKSEVGDEEIKTIRPLVLSTMPVDRAEILSHLTLTSGLSIKELASKIKKSGKTIGRTLKELEVLGIVDYYKDSKQITSSKAPRLFFIMEEFASILEAPIPSPECLEYRRENIGEGESTEKNYDEVEDEKVVILQVTKSGSDFKKDMPF